MKTRADGRRSIRLRDFDYAKAGAYFVTICAQDRACVFGNVVDGRVCLSAAGLMVRRVWDELPRFYAGVGIDAFVVMPNHVHGIVILSGGFPNGLDDGPAASDREDWPDAYGRDFGAAPFGRDVGAAPFGRDVGAAPFGRDFGAAPLGRDVGAAPLGRDVGAAPCGRPVSSVPRDRASTPIGPIGPGQARGPAPTEPFRGPGPTDAVDSETVDEGRGTNAQFRRPLSLGDVMHRFKTMTTKLYADGVREAQWPPFHRRLWQRDYFEHIIRDASALQRIRSYIERNPLRWRTDAQYPNGDASFDKR